MRVVIIEDEPLMAQELENEILKVDDSIEILGKFESVKDSLTYLTKNELPDLFFSDIQLSDGLSFEIFQEIDNSIPIIFCTAFNEYALEGFNANGIDYLLKPFDNEAISRTIAKYKKLTKPKDLSGELRSLFQTLNNEISQKNSLLVHRGSKIFPIKNADVRLAYLNNGITSIITKDHKKHIVNYSLDALDDILGKDFYRANRQIIIHREAIIHVSQYFARKLLVEIKIPFDERVIVSKANASNFLKWLES
ncbi:MAG: LytTR family DNA-binding domain-containing protein [Ekhidna sp.]